MAFGPAPSAVVTVDLPAADAPVFPGFGRLPALGTLVIATSCFNLVQVTALSAARRLIVLPGAAVFAVRHRDWRTGRHGEKGVGAERGSAQPE